MLCMRASTPYQECWVARLGHVVEKRRGDQQGILYDTLVNTVRSQIPNRTEFIHAKVTDIATGPERQTVKLSNGDEITARLVVLATGLNIGLRQKLGIEPRNHQPRPFDLDRLRRQAGRIGEHSRSPR